MKVNADNHAGVQTLSEDLQRDMTLMFTLIGEFRNIRKDMPMSNAFAFVLVAQEEGLSVSEYARRAGAGQTVMTRWLFDIGSHSRSREPGLGLVTQRPDPNDMRRHQTFLTDEGRQLSHRLGRLLRLRGPG